MYSRIVIFIFAAKFIILGRSGEDIDITFDELIQWYPVGKLAAAPHMEALGAKALEGDGMLRDPFCSPTPPPPPSIRFNAGLLQSYLDFFKHINARLSNH